MPGPRPLPLPWSRPDEHRSPTDPWAVWEADGVWAILVHGRVLGHVRQYIDGRPYRYLYGVYTHGVDETGRRVWHASRPTLGGASAYVRQHAGGLAAETKALAADPYTASLEA